MAGTLTVGTISDETNSTSATNIIRGCAKVWANYNSSASISRSLNVSSVSLPSTGNFTVNITSALPSSSYSSVTTTTGSNFGSVQTVLGSSGSFSTSAFSLLAVAHSGSIVAFNPGATSVAVFV